MDPLTYLDQQIFGQSFLGATGYQWLTLLAVWAGAAVGLVLLHRFLVWRVSKFAERTTNVVDDYLAEFVRSTRAYFLITLGLYIASVVVPLPETPTRWIGRLMFVVLLLQVVRWGNTFISTWIARYKDRMLEKDAAAVTTMQAVGYLGRLALWTIVVLLALDNFGIDVTALVAGLGVGGIAVALAVQSILGDLFASLSIVLDKPFVVGDFLIIDDYLGTVEKIGLKTTRVRSLSGEQLIFSNSDLLKSRIRNYKRMYERRVVFGFGVVYQTPPDTLAQIGDWVQELVEEQDQTRFDRAHFKEYGESSLNFEVVYFVLAPDYNLYMDIQEAINLGIYRKFEAEGVDFAYPTRTLFVQQASEDGTAKTRASEVV